MYTSTTKPAEQLSASGMVAGDQYPPISRMAYTTINHTDTATILLWSTVLAYPASVRRTAGCLHLIRTISLPQWTENIRNSQCLLRGQPYGLKDSFY